MNTALHSLDYGIFTIVSVVAFGVLAGLMRRKRTHLPAITWVLVGGILVGGWWPVEHAGKVERERIEQMVAGMAPTYADSLQKMGHARLVLETAADDPLYLSMIETEKRWLKANPAVQDIYTMRKTAEGRNVFLVDSETDYDDNGLFEGEREARTVPGEEYDVADKGMELAFTGVANFDQDLVTDRWGTWVSSWTPMFGENGQIEAVLGVDYDARAWVEAVAAARRGPITALAVLLILVASAALIIAILRADIVKRQAIEDELRQSQQKLALRAQQTPLAMIEWDLDLRVTDWNAAAEGLFGYAKAEAIGDGALIERLAPESIRQQITALLAGASIEKKSAIPATIDPTISKGGHPIACDWFNAPLLDSNGRIIGVTSLCEDITERRQLEEQLRQAQKMEAVGQLAGGIAHDFNNLLCVMQGYADLARGQKGVTPEIMADLDEIAAGAERAAALTKQLLTFSRRQVFQPKNLNMNEAVNNVAKMLRRVLGEHNSLVTHFVPHLPDVKADKGMIEQILLNLTVNARDAMPKGGRLVVTTSTRFVSEKEAACHADVATGPFVCLEVADSGCGIAPEDLPRIFDPFFTTKEIERGTGLGLATVYGIVRQHCGWVEVDSDRGRGTTFRIFLPAVTIELYPEEPVELEPARGGSETILVVEDETPVRDFVCRTLTQSGYRVLLACSGTEAIDVWRQRREEIDLVLTDMVMPEGISGADLGKRLRTDGDDVKVIYTSGYSTEFVGRTIALQPGVNFLQKPYQSQQLIRTVRAYLDQ